VSQLAGKPNSVSRRSATANDHSSTPAIARRLQRPTRWRSPPPKRKRLGRAARSRHPIWSCSVRGFACHRRYRRRGALLPHLFTLTLRLGACAPRSGRYFFCATVRQVTLPGRYPAHCPSEFGLSSPRLTTTRFARGKLADAGLPW